MTVIITIYIPWRLLVKVSRAINQETGTAFEILVPVSPGSTLLMRKKNLEERNSTWKIMGLCECQSECRGDVLKIMKT